MNKLVDFSREAFSDFNRIALQGSSISYQSLSYDTSNHVRYHDMIKLLV